MHSIPMMIDEAHDYTSRPVSHVALDEVNAYQYTLPRQMTSIRRD